jgi:hypothetical protein
MTWFRIKNKTNLPVHVVISQADIIYFHVNDLAPGGYWEADVGLGGYDLTVVPSNGSNQIDPAKHNMSAVTGWVVGAAAVVVGAIGVVAIPFTAGTSVAWTIAAAGAAVAGAGATIADVTVAIADAVLNPVTISNLYGPDGYNFEIVGGEVIGDKVGNTFTVTKINPFRVHWHNNKTGTGDFNGKLT